jgi:glycosyltransferase involved in cell wall biosynthesis
VAVSNAVADDARKLLPRVPIQVVHNVADLARFSPEATLGDLLDDLAGLPAAAPGTVRVVLVATYARWKGQDVFLDAAAVAARNSPDVPLRFYIVGGRIYRTAGSQFSQQELRAKAEQLGIANCVGFIGFQEEPAGVYRAADVVVHASVQPEPFGLTIIESMACGRATIIARAGGAAELFTDGYDAIGVPPGRPDTLAMAIARLAADRELRERLGEKARLAVQSRFNPQDLPSHVRRLYEPLLGRC